MSVELHSQQRLVIDELGVSTTRSGRSIVPAVTLDVRAGEILGLVGESGSGKTTTGLAVLGYARRGLRIDRGKILIDGTDILHVGDAQRRSMRGASVAYVPQDPGAALNPGLRIDEQLLEILQAHEPGLSRQAVNARIDALLERVQLPEPGRVRAKFPHQLSGGQQQRVAIAMAFLCAPAVIVLDEPTTGLDVSTQHHILTMVRELCRDQQAAAVYVSHDLAVVRALAHRVAVMLQGEVVEQGLTDEVFARPQHPYTKKLLDAVPTGFRDNSDLDTIATAPTVLSVNDLVANYGSAEVLHGVTFELRAGECLGVVGESGSGKSTLARCVIGLHSEVRSGRVSLDGEVLDSRVRRRKQRQWQRMQFVFQNPYASLNPRRTIGDSILTVMKQVRPDFLSEGRERVLRALEDVALPSDYIDRYPDQLSGGERQRAAIARALVVEPDVLICDEVTSALDVSVQAVVIRTLRMLQRSRGFAMVFITHNITLVQEIAQSVLVMSQGSVVEAGSATEVLTEPKHPYTKALLSDIVTIEPRQQ